jgi:tetratricopeptide (TPR) repeat protein
LKKVFLSSTFRDLAAYREAVIKALEGLDGWHCVRMETFGARDREADEFCRKKVAECDLFVGVLGHLYGTCPPGKDKSYTEREYDAAVEAKLPRLMFIAPQDFNVPANLIEPDAQRKKQADFRSRASAERMRATFTTPADLAALVVQAIHNWEQEQPRLEERRKSDPGAELRPLPPQPWFVHPYPLQKGFTGRVKEREMLTLWLAAGSEPVFVMEAIGGMGKSAVTWAWVQHDVLGFPLPGAAEDACRADDKTRLPDAGKPEGYFWWSFYESKSSFGSFVDAALVYSSSGRLDSKDIPSLYDKTNALLNLLQQHRYLLVLDGFERLLRAYCGMGAAYQGDESAVDPQADILACVEPLAGSFLQACCQPAIRSRVLMTTRLFPRELQNLAGCLHVELPGFQPEDAVAYFHAQGIKGARHEIEAACAPYEYHPLALSLLAGIALRDMKNPGDIKAVGKHPVLADLKARQHHILETAYNTLGKDKQQLLSRIAAFRSPVDYDAVKAVSTVGDENLNDALVELESRKLLLFDRERKRFDLHPIVRRYAYDRLGEKDRTGVHAQLRDYFAAVPAKDKIQSVDDLQPVIELYHHTVRAGRYNEAVVLYRDRLARTLYFRLGAYQVVTELLRTLFPDGEDKPPQLESEAAQAWALNELANSCLLSGQPRKAVPLLQRCAALSEKNKDSWNVAVDLWNLACGAQTPRGEFKAAEQNLRRSIEICKEIRDESSEADGLRGLGRLLVYEGRQDDAERELDSALGSFESRHRPQSQGLIEAHRSLRHLLIGDAKRALKHAQEARKLADVRCNERDIIRAEWLLGWAKTESGNTAEAEDHLTEALTRCRRINSVEREPDILLAWARWHKAKGNAAGARKHAEEALTIADRCEYRLRQADIHNFLARLDLDEGRRDSARKHADVAKERAFCDGPPHCYKPALDEAERLLAEIAKAKKRG